MSVCACAVVQIVAAVREGRRVWDNLRKILLFNLPVNFAQVRAERMGMLTTLHQRCNRQHVLQRCLLECCSRAACCCWCVAGRLHLLGFCRRLR